MPRAGSLASDICDFLRHRDGAAELKEIITGLNEVRRFRVLPHSVRSALHQHLDERGEQLFTRTSRGCYELRPRG